jgi:hypothetical protein
MKKSELRNIIKEEIKSLLKEENYAEKLAKKLVKTNQVKKGLPEKELISIIIKNAKKEIDPKTLKYWLMKDNDFLSDAISAVNDLVGR